jgi:hypothetical protein
MSLRHALIGLLAEQPASGWDLTQRFEDLLGTVWPAGHPQIAAEAGIRLHEALGDWATWAVNHPPNAL